MQFSNVTLGFLIFKYSPVNVQQIITPEEFHEISHLLIVHLNAEYVHVTATFPPNLAISRQNQLFEKIAVRRVSNYIQSCYVNS